eukprot:2085596-Rhodomonas_salina.1
MHHVRIGDDSQHHVHDACDATGGSAIQHAQGSGPADDAATQATGNGYQAADALTAHAQGSGKQH